MSTSTYDIIIIGSGPSGYTAALYAARSSHSVLAVQGYQAGGQLMQTTDIENYPGFAHGILGPDLMENFEQQARRFGATMVPEDVIVVNFQQQPFIVQTDSTQYSGRAIIVATGASAKWLNLPSEQRLIGQGVSACATCDGFFFRGKDVAIVGGGDTAMEEALYLTRHANHVTLIHRRATLRASKIMQQRVLDHPKIDVVLEHEITEVLGDNAVTGVQLRQTTTGEETHLDVQGLFVQGLFVQGLFIAIGHEPNTHLFHGVLETDEVGYISQRAYTMTNIPGVFAAGDVSDHRYRQAITAAADGCRAAIDAERWLAEQGIDIGIEQWD